VNSTISLMLTEKCANFSSNSDCDDGICLGTKCRSCLKDEEIFAIAKCNVCISTAWLKERKLLRAHLFKGSLYPGWATVRYPGSSSSCLRIGKNTCVSYSLFGARRLQLFNYGGFSTQPSA